MESVLFALAHGSRQTLCDQLVEQINGIVLSDGFEHVGESHQGGDTAFLRHARDGLRPSRRGITRQGYHAPPWDAGEVELLISKARISVNRANASTSAGELMRVGAQRSRSSVERRAPAGTVSKESTKIRGVCNIRSSESMGTFARPKRAVAKTPMFLKSSKRVQPSSGLYNQQVKCPPPGF